MKKHLDAVTAAQTASADTALALMQSTLDAIERLAALNLNTMRDTLESATEQSSKLAKAKDLAEASELQKTAAQPSMERTRAYYHQVHELMSEMQEHLTKVMQAHYSMLSESASTATQTIAASAPMGGEAFAAAMKTMLDSSAQAYERINETAHQLQASARQAGAAIGKKTPPAATKATSAARSKKV